MAAARVGGIHANNSRPALFIRDNLLIQDNVIDCGPSLRASAKFVFLGSSCIYPKLAPQPIKEEYLLTGPLEPTNEWYADRQDRRAQDVPSLPARVRLQCHFLDADQPVRSRATTSICRTRTCCRR